MMVNNIFLVVYLPLWKMVEFVSWDDDIFFSSAHQRGWLGSAGVSHAATARRETKAGGGLHHPSEPRQGGGRAMPGALAWGSGGEIHSTPSAVAHTPFWRAILRKPHHRRCQPCAAACRSGGGARGLRTATSRRTSCRHSECHRPPTSAPSIKRRWGPPPSSSG